MARMDAKSIWNTAITRIDYSSTYKVMKRPQRKDYPSHQAWVSAMDKYNAAKPKRKDYKSHADWVTATDAFNKKGKTVKKTNSVKKVYSNNRNKKKTNVDLKVKKDLPPSKETSVSIRANQKKNKAVVKKVEKPKAEVKKAEVKKVETPKTEVKKTEVKKKTTREKFNEKFIRTKGGKLVRRGTVGARRAENKEAARTRAQAAAKLRIKKKKEKKV